MYHSAVPAVSFTHFTHITPHVSGPKGLSQIEIRPMINWWWDVDISQYYGLNSKKSSFQNPHSWITSEKLALKKSSLKLSWCVSVLYFGYFNVSKPKNITYLIPGDSYCWTSLYVKKKEYSSQEAKRILKGAIISLFICIPTCWIQAKSLSTLLEHWHVPLHVIL